MSQGLTDHQKDLLRGFEDLEKDFNETGINEIYLKSSLSMTEEAGREWNMQPITEEVDMEPQYSQLRDRLKQFKKRSKLVQEVGNLMHEYQLNYRHMLNQKQQLMQLISSLSKDTSDLIQKQKNYIDLSIAVKQSLDYYSYLDKFEFNWACEPSCRDMFEDQLRPILSQLTDAIEFFSSNINYSSAKKYLSGLAACRQKVTSFTKSFFIKILNKEYTFSHKNCRPSLWKHIDSFYPKSKAKFLFQFISCFPQLKKSLKMVLLSAKEANPEADVHQLQLKELQIEDFQFNDSSLSLISYLQTHIPEIYEQVILKFISFYRISFHENLHKTLQLDPSLKFTESFREAFIQVAYILVSEASYLSYCFRPNCQIAFEYSKTTLKKIAEFYGQTLVKLAKDPNKNKDPFGLCNEVSYLLEQTDKFLRNYLSRQYQTYALGAIIQYIEDIGVDFVKNLIIAIGNKIKHQLEIPCQNFLPKFKLENDQGKLTEQVKEFIDMIPNLKYCPTQAEKYLVSSLDTLIKSVKEVNNKIQSRMQCYAWNIQIFAAIEENLSRLPYNLVKKQMRLDMNETTSIFDKVKRVNRDDNLLKYATDIFSVIKTGMPTLNELTLDFNKFIREYHESLRRKFVKDMVFVHAKNIIQFLQKLKQAPEEEIKSACTLNLLKNLHSGYLLSIQNFVQQAKGISKARSDFILYQDGQRQLKMLLDSVQEALLDLMSAFYIQTSKYCEQTDQFQPISKIKARLQEK